MLDIYVINLEERKDRWNHILNKFGKIFNLIKIDAIKHEKGNIGCFLSHIKCLKIAKEKNLKNIIILEDDCTYLLEDNIFLEKVINIQNFLDNYKDWDIFLGGCNKTKEYHIIKKIKNANESIYQIKKSNTAHFIIYNNTIYDFYINYDKIEDPYIDILWHNKLKALTIIPFIAYQLPGFSNIENKYVNYNSIKLTEERLLKYVKENNL